MTELLSTDRTKSQNQLIARAGASPSMCYPRKCSKCGKQSWGGCGAHKESVLRGVPPEGRCLCRGPEGAALDRETYLKLGGDPEAKAGGEECIIS